MISPLHVPAVIFPDDMVKPFIAPVVVSVPLMVTAPEARDSKSGSTTPNPMSPLLFNKTPPPRIDPLTSKA